MLITQLVQIPLPPHPPLIVHTTHPLILLPLTFLVSATAKRDPVGRNPKRRLWAEAAINVLNTATEDIERKFYFVVPSITVVTFIYLQCPSGLP